MPNVPLLQPADATQPVQAVYDEFTSRMCFPAPPNFILTQGHSDTVVRGTWELVRNVLVTGQVPRWVKEMMFVAISSDRRCRYCAAAHIACCRMLGVSQDLIASLVRDVYSIRDVKLRDILLFALKTSRSPQALDHADFETLRHHGLKDPEIVEIIGMSALAVYANIMADATAMEPDDMFELLPHASR